MGTVQSEPILAGTAVTGVVTAALGVASAWGWNLDTAQQTSIYGIVTALIVAVGVWQRSKSTPTAKATDAIKTALAFDPGHPANPKPEEILATAKP